MAGGQDGAVVRSIWALYDTGAIGGLTDAQLLDRFLVRRDEAAEAAFEIVVVRHGPMVLDICRNVLRDAEEAQDAFQATFLILACKAGAIRRRDALGSWLFGVARRVAIRARSETARRRARERIVAEATATEYVPDEMSRDLSMLHEELDRLPRKYLDPVVLCDLEGLTYEEAARRLQCPLGTVSVRLKRARERLRSRLTRRGLAAPAGLVLPRPSSASPTPPLVRSAVRIATGFAAGRAAMSGSVSALTLAQGVLKPMLFQSHKLVGLSVASLCLAAIGGGVLVGQQEPVAKPKAQGVSARDNPVPGAPQDVDRDLHSRLVAGARRRVDSASAFYEEGRSGFSIDRVIDALAQLKDAEALAATSGAEKVAASEKFLEQLQTIEKREKAELEAGRGTIADVHEIVLRRLQAEMELRRARSPGGPLGLDSLDRRLGDVERKLDLILKSLPASTSPRR